MRAILCLLASLAGTVAWATVSVASAPAAGAPRGAASYFAGVQLIDQDGRTVDLYRDLIDGHTVVIHSFFARCTSSCPVMFTTLKAAQERLGDRLGRDVRFISISVDPDNDTPTVLKGYAQRVKARPGWSFLSGDRSQVDTALKRIGQYATEPAAHADLIVAGNARTGLWKKLHGLASGADIVELIVGVADDAGDGPIGPVAQGATLTGQR